MLASSQLNQHNTVLVESPMPAFAEQILKRQTDVEKWFRINWVATPAPFYASCDLRNSGYKVAPVDTNLFPAGFNNLSPETDDMMKFALQVAVENCCPDASKIIIITENHTRNLKYLESLYHLRNLLTQAGFIIHLARLSDDLQEVSTIQLSTEKTLTFYPLKRIGNKLCVEDFMPDLILLNNDLSEGQSPILENLDQYVLPPLSLGWQKRTKAQHFSQYTQVVKDFSSVFDIDPWLLTPVQSVSKGINFSSGEGIDELVEQVNTILEQTQSKYNSMGVCDNPYTVVKANSGTYGMGVMTITDSKDLFVLNRKQRSKMKMGKGGRNIDELLVQEGIPSYESIVSNQAVAEPVVYMVNHYVVGGFYRIHKSRGANQNLNTPGMYFEPLSFDLCMNQSQDQYNIFSKSLFYLYGVVARLGLLAAAREIVGKKKS